MDGRQNQTVVMLHRGDPDGISQNTASEARDQAASWMPVAKSATPLFVLLLSMRNCKSVRFSGDEFGVGDVAIAPFICYLF